jgi:hypothetical protein
LLFGSAHVDILPVEVEATLEATAQAIAMGVDD